jgi:hypothetical protein
MIGTILTMWNLRSWVATPEEGSDFRCRKYAAPRFVAAN